MIYKFEYFSDIDLIVERLHINDKIDKYSDKIYPIIKNSEKYKFEFIDLPIGLNISKLTILLKDMRPGLSGELDVNKSHKTDSGWTIHINLKKDFALYTLKHELNHAFDKLLNTYEKKCELYTNKNVCFSKIKLLVQIFKDSINNKVVYKKNKFSL